MTKRLVVIALCALLVGGGASAAPVRDQIRIVGSSTVFPFTTTVAEAFGKSGSFKTPVVEATGTGGGLKLFCSGVGPETPDIANASRRIKASEVVQCAKNGVTEITEIKIGYDGIVLARSRADAPMALTSRQLFLALAREVPDASGALIANPYRFWNQIDPSLPKIKIEVLGPPPTSGTRDAFVELAMEGGAKQIPALASLSARDENAFKAVTHALREDGVFIEAGENDNLIVQKLLVNPDAFGIFGFSYLEQNMDKIQPVSIDGAIPEFENIADGSYGISRSLYLYVKKAHVGAVVGLSAYLDAFTSAAAWGDEGYLVDKGLIPLSAEERQTYRRVAETLPALAL